MRPAATLMQLALAVSSVAPVVSAWPNWLPERDALIVRADSSDSSDSATPSATATPSASGSSASNTKETGKATGGNTAMPTKSATGSKSKSSSTPTHTSFAPDSPVGGVSMIVPANTALGTALYKISDYVTFSWNYTSLQGTPTAVDVLASCSTARATWTLTGNMTFATSVEYVWDTKVQANDPNQPLLTEQYSLIIKDSDISMTDTPEPGYLGVSTALSFGLYSGKAYQNWSQWTCPGCHASAASPAVHGQSIKFAATMSIATVIGFTWFVTGLGIN
ncbi:hypothetical protein ISF_04465 [Cordyceps fumosorosea ARSEF 2679]|uniref:DUF7137 domain-containing protein n=1 Tax=Cordyceps fumosorosea (strain ARSEF 2679) TaxID=1081104 RepID=A0A167XJP9_CORFA|nr:hypothetical protein ISF_04465 [Cordyceps fumosorosea ARSEF 2679]OAA65055.1 hypothetical protein ISF_04465 [Cordyceps fumosorosea ARSEF 2679]